LQVNFNFSLRKNIFTKIRDGKEIEDITPIIRNIHTNCALSPEACETTFIYFKLILSLITINSTDRCAEEGT